MYGCLKAKNRDGGFSLLEMVMAISIVAMLAAIHFKMIRPPIEQASGVLITYQAGVFSRHVNAFRSFPSGSWKNYVEHQGLKIFFNEYGWPANTLAEMSPLSNNQTAQECWQLWQGIFQNPLKASADFGNSNKKTQVDSRYKIYSKNGNTCRYQLAGKGEDVYFFDYDLRTGVVITSHSAQESAL